MVEDRAGIAAAAADDVPIMPVATRVRVTASAGYLGVFITCTSNSETATSRDSGTVGVPSINVNSRGKYVKFGKRNPAWETAGYVFIAAGGSAGIAGRRVST
jgi:hypothetical protein